MKFAHMQVQEAIWKKLCYSSILYNARKSEAFDINKAYCELIALWLRRILLF